MLEKKLKPWRFTVVFDETKATKNNYDMNTLYDYVDKTVAGYGMERVTANTWQPIDGKDEAVAQCGALSMLSKTQWVMKNIQTLVFHEGSEEAYDFIEETRKSNPERVFD